MRLGWMLGLRKGIELGRYRAETGMGMGVCKYAL